MKRRTFLQGAAGVAGAAVSGFSLASRPTAVTPPVSTNAGPVLGYVAEGVNQFKGLRYAEPPIGKLRFRRAQPLTPWKQPVAALNFGPASMQLSSGGSAVTYPGAVGPALNQVFGSGRDRITMDKDCLCLNVWTKGLDNAARPVMVWFHGGGHHYGSGSWPAYDGHNMARDHDVVVVTVNHRLNTFGFLAVGDNPGEAANAGELDLVSALSWVRDNIAGFGGNPDNVTIFGQSGGGSKVSHCLVMPDANGLVHKGIIQSGGGLTTGTMDNALETAERVAAKLGLKRKQLDRLQQIPARELLAAAVSVRARFGPCADGEHVPHAPFGPVSNQQQNIPLVIGHTKDERTLYNIGYSWWGNLTDTELAKRATRAYGDQGTAILDAWKAVHPDYSNDYLYCDLTNAHAYRTYGKADAKVQAGAAPVWVYQWDWEAPVENGILRSPHTMEIPFIFNNVDKGPILLGAAESTRRLGYVASRAWANFARHGDPNSDGLPTWPAYDSERRQTMLFDVQSAVVNDPLGRARELMSAFHT